MTLLLNRELLSKAKLCLVYFLPDIVRDCPKVRNLRKIFLRSFENVKIESCFVMLVADRADVELSV